MTYDEYKSKINDMIANPDKVAVYAVDLLAELEKDTSIITQAHIDKQASDAKIRELQEANYQMFLRMTDGQPSSNAASGAQEPENVIAAIFDEKEGE